jgi:hypothetical protein
MLTRKSKVGADFDEPFGPELTAEGLHSTRFRLET